MLRIFDTKWSTTIAGPSPEGNQRTELFLKGCQKALQGSPCPGCFNQPLWDDWAEKFHRPEDVAEQIARFAPKKYVTIGGGEPTDQFEGLIELCWHLKKKDFHILVYTHKELETALLGPQVPYFEALLESIDILVDGPYEPSQRVYNEAAEDGFLNSIGSGNQVVWDVNRKRGYAMRDIIHMHLRPDRQLVFVLKQDALPKFFELERSVV